MNIDLHTKASLAATPGELISEEALLDEYERRGLAAADARHAMDKALVDGWIERTDKGVLRKLARSRGLDEAGALA